MQIRNVNSKCSDSYLNITLKVVLMKDHQKRSKTHRDLLFFLAAAEELVEGGVGLRLDGTTSGLAGMGSRSGVSSTITSSLGSTSSPTVNTLDTFKTTHSYLMEMQLKNNFMCLTSSKLQLLIYIHKSKQYQNKYQNYIPLA